MSEPLAQSVDVAESEQTGPRPLIFVPGFMASALERAGRGLLQPPLAVWPLNIYTLTAQLLILRNQAPLKANRLVGHYYDGLLDFIMRPLAQLGLGHSLNQDFWIFTYDWRKSSHTSGEALAAFVAEKLAQSNARRSEQGLPAWTEVSIICHSMGGFVVRSAQREFAAPIEGVVYLASGHYGFTKAYFALHPATASRMLDNFLKDFIPLWYWDLLKTLPNVWFLQGWLAKLLRTFPAMYELLPDQFYLEEPPGLLLNASQLPPQPVIGLEETYFQHGWQLPSDLHLRIKTAMQFKERLGRDLPGHKNLAIYAETLPTYARVSYTTYFGAIETLPLGDLTVTAPSASRAEPAKRIVIEASHVELPNLNETHAAIRAFLVESSLI